MKNENLHKGHRARLRDRFLKSGLDGFEAHQVLELILFSAIPRRDTNEIAHRLLQRFGSLPAVLDADVRELTSVEGVGPSAAYLLTLFRAVARRYMLDSAAPNPDAVYLLCAQDACRYVQNLFIGCRTEVCYALLLNSRRRVIACRRVEGGSIDSLRLNPQWVASFLFDNHAASVILAHNHPGAPAEPSPGDAAVTEKVAACLSVLGGALLDHIIAGENGVVSYSENLRRFPPLHPDTFSPYYA
ncbi:MAG: JAB domain-containing protein [Clostridiaceae bacterium]|nr:JAB domain-containing protein [Clostridiaceae bacterium]